MRTTLNIDDELLLEAQKLTGVVEKTALVREGLRARRVLTGGKLCKSSRLRPAHRERGLVYEGVGSIVELI